MKVEISSKYPIDLAPAMYYLQIGLVVGQLIKGEDEVPETFKQLDDFIFNKFGKDISSKDAINRKDDGLLELRDYMFDLLANRLVCESEIDNSLEAFDKAMGIIE